MKWKQIVGHATQWLDDQPELSLNEKKKSFKIVASAT